MAESKFPKPWRVEYCGDCYRIFDVNNRQLFVIVGDEFGGDENEDPAKGTVFDHGDADEQASLAHEIERLFGVKETSAEQAWLDEVQKIVCTFVQNDVELGELMLDHSERYWNDCLEKGLTPQEALDRFPKQYRKKA